MSAHVRRSAMFAVVGWNVVLFGAAMLFAYSTIQRIDPGSLENVGGWAIGVVIAQPTEVSDIHPQRESTPRSQ